MLSIPRDEVIFEEVRFFGEWEKYEASYLAKYLNKSSGSKERERILLDIGANTGLISRQVLLKSKVKTHAILVEPIPSHVEAINFNLRDLRTAVQVDVHPFALGRGNSTSTIFVEDRNHGNSSLLRGVVPERNSSSLEIQVVDAEDFARTYLGVNEKIILKCDTQGFDARILARLPKDVWGRVEAAVIEIWAIPEISAADVVQCFENWRDFTYVSWSGRSKGKVSQEEITDFWLGKSLESKNLFLRK